ncbi:hypothetical protein NDU88_001048 [Pleurodeles waltl]|uniref:Uncharacterized protein n=1 Tax=Pleurodeles waltl TaxID=8319 RepID=A0AAV7TGP6_PLEWA|nr:hypothetical protein NDU88_001048 [Pleurodeles waltl]
METETSSFNSVCTLSRSTARATGFSPPEHKEFEVNMELNKVVQALKTLRDEGREDLIKEGVLEEAWVGLKRPRRLSAQGVSAAVAACSSPLGKAKKFKTKSAEGRKVARSPVQPQEVLVSALGPEVASVSRRRGAGRLLRRSGISLARRVAAGGRGVGRVGAMAGGERQGARLASACHAGQQRGGWGRKQAQLPRENAAELEAAILKERTLGATNKMAAPTEKFSFMGSRLGKGQAVDTIIFEECGEREEEVIVISDEELDGQGGFGYIPEAMGLLEECDVEMGSGAVGLGETGFGKEWRVESYGANVRDSNVLEVSEQLVCADLEGVMTRGLGSGQAGRSTGRGEVSVLANRWQPGLQDFSAGCDAPRFLGRLSEMVHQDAGRHAGGQSLPVKARAPLVHRKEGRVNSGAVYPTAREAGARCSLGHSAGSVLEDEQPSTSWGAGASFGRQEETLLDYEEDDEVQNARVVVPVLQPTVPEVVQGDHSKNRRSTPGNLPRGEIGMGLGRIVGGYGREVCGAGGVDASVQVDCIAVAGAGKSEVTGVVPKDDELNVLQESVKEGGVLSADVSGRAVSFWVLSFGEGLQ